MERELKHDSIVFERETVSFAALAAVVERISCMRAAASTCARAECANASETRVEEEEAGEETAVEEDAVIDDKEVAEEPATGHSDDIDAIAAADACVFIKRMFAFVMIARVADTSSPNVRRTRWEDDDSPRDAAAVLEKESILETSKKQ